MSDYASFVAGKRRARLAVGFEPTELLPNLFPFQAAVVRWALRLGRAAIFAGTGLGKTVQQIEWAQRVSDHTGERVLIIAPLAVASQTVAEGAHFGIPITHCRERSDVRSGVNITNYERFDRFDPRDFSGIVLDESSILKSSDGKTRTALIDAWSKTHYRLACTATPAPNDVMELASHAGFLGVSTRAEMLATYFVHDGGETQKWRLKGHAQEPFWEWLASWSVMFRSPADIGYPTEQFTLPPLQMHQHIVESTSAPDGMLFAVEAQTLGDRQRARRSSVEERARTCADVVAREPHEQWLIWTDLNAESEAVRNLIDGAVQVTGSDDPDVKEQRLLDFASGKIRVLVSKPSICGFGMNFQRCARVVFVGLSDSWESYFQAIRRCWRFGQTRPVECHVIIASAEGAVLANIERKERDAARLTEAMIGRMGLYSELNVVERTAEPLTSTTLQLPKWVAA